MEIFGATLFAAALGIWSVVGVLLVHTVGG